MTKMEYANKVAEMVNGEIKMVDKANGVVLTGIMPKEGNVRPTVYIEDFYETDNVETAAEKIKEIFSENLNIPFNTDDISDYDKIKSKIVARLYNRKTNAEVFRSAAPYGFEDLIIVPYIQLTDEAAIKVTRNLVDNVWKVTDEEALITAVENIDCKIYTMTEILKELMGDFPSDDELGMYVITNKSKQFGASSALVADEKLREIFPEGYIILPSSVHEVIVISKNNNNSPLTQMICEVNQTQVAETEVLSDHEYYF